MNKQEYQKRLEEILDEQFKRLGGKPMTNQSELLKALEEV